MERTSIKFDKPIAIGMAVLDLSNYYYNHLKKTYENKVQLVYTDTDSFVIEVKTECFYTEMKKYITLYDTSDFPKNNQFKVPLVNKKVPGLFRDELNGQILTSFVGLRSKMYCVLCGNIEMMKKAKGVKKSALKKQTDYNDYLECLVFGDPKMVKQNTFRTKQHNMYSISQDKIGLSAADDKRVIASDNIHTYSYGHCHLPN